MRPPGWGYDRLVPWVLILAGATLAGVAIIVVAAVRLRRAMKAFSHEAGRCLDDLQDRAAFLSTLGTPADWSRPGEARP
jgi:hypothetical protein